LEDREDWLMVPVSQTRDSEALDRVNFAAALSILGGEGEDVEVHRFGHWGPGWYEVIIVRPGTEAAKGAEDIAARLEDYPVLDEDELSREEWEEACAMWEGMRPKDRIEYMRDHWSLFSFANFSELLACARGNVFCGVASELIQP
jgi:hypothetical protein